MITTYGHKLTKAKATYFYKQKAYLDTAFAAYTLVALVANGRSKMADQMEVDIEDILLNDFGIQVVVTPNPIDGVPYLLQGLFDSPFLDSDMGSVSVEMQNASFSYQTSTANISEGTEITIGSVIYEVIRIESDGSLPASGGMTKAVLRIKG